ncbi:MAG: hypothetical protein OEU26_02495, partial [Candidatus Tectomicrobia bacterium]|nr:hypothetical protein [Candidatus Tectomicrobia bacterium]
AEREQLGGIESPRQFLWRNPEYGLDRADAVSTPTPIDLKSVLVPGAAYTSLTLWNWANGELVDHVRAITRDTSSRKRLLEWIADKDPDRVRFALDTLAHRQILDQEVVAAVLNRSQKKDGDWIRAAWPYLIAATPDRPGRRNVYLTLMTHSTSTQRPFLLERLTEEQQVPEDWFEPLSRFLGDFETYYEVHLFLNLLSVHQVRDPRVIQRVAPLRNDPNVFIARRVDRFLRDQPRITLPSPSGRNPS